MNKEIEIPEGYEAKIEDNKVVFIPKESEDNKIRNRLITLIHILDKTFFSGDNPSKEQCLAYLEKQKDCELTEDDKKFIPQELIFLCNDLISHRKPLSVDEKGARKIKAFLKSLHGLSHKTKEEWERQKEQKLSTEETELNSIAFLEQMGYTCIPPRAEQPEVDLEKVIGQTYHDGSVADTSDMDHVDYENIAHHFYELGLKARKEEE